jgi:hypothetical protein
MRGTLARPTQHNDNNSNNDCQRRCSPFIDTAAAAVFVLLFIIITVAVCQCSTLNYEQFHLIDVIVFQKGFHLSYTYLLSYNILHYTVTDHYKYNMRLK